LKAAVVAVSRSKLQEASGLTGRMHFTNSLLKPLLESGLLEMTIPDKPNSSKQKYRITKLGQEFLENKK
jgi:ATP-dependent DNA helicase RecG